MPSNNLDKFTVNKDDILDNLQVDNATGDYSQAIPVTLTLVPSSSVNIAITGPVVQSGTLYKTGNIYNLTMQISSSNFTIGTSSASIVMLFAITGANIGYTPIRGSANVGTKNPPSVPPYSSYYLTFNELTIMWTSGASDAGYSPDISFSITYSV